MTNAEAIRVARQGGRVTTHHSFHAEEDRAKSAACSHTWRVIACDDNTDVLECTYCGAQRLAVRDFNDDMN